MKTYEIKTKICGVEPGLLMHRFSSRDAAALAGTSCKAGKVQPSPEEEARESAYTLPDGELYQPAEHIYQAMCKAGSQFQVKGRGKITFKTIVAGNLLILPEQIPHGTKSYEIDIRPVVIRATRGRIMRARPLLKEWSLEFTMKVLDADVLSSITLNEILWKAGESIGIGDYRPRFGRFTIKSFLTV